MSQRQLIRRILMELPTNSMSQGERATPRSSGDATEVVVVQSGSNLPTLSSSNDNKNSNEWELQHLGGREQDPLLHNSSKVTRPSFTLLDVVRETVQLTRARSTYFLWFLPTFILVLLLLNGINDSVVFSHQNQKSNYVYTDVHHSCETKILNPWVTAALTNNLSSAQQEEFYTQFRHNCSMFKDPATLERMFMFRNGTITLGRSSGFQPSFGPIISTHFVATVVLDGLRYVWTCWGQVALAWGLYVATTSTMSHHSRPSHRDPLHMPSQKPIEVFREQFSYKVFLGTIRVALTGILTRTATFWAMLSVHLVSETWNRFVTTQPIEDMGKPATGLWSLVNLLPLLFLFSGTAAALEPGMYGFKALWRSIELAGGNRLKSYVIFVVLGLWSWLLTYLDSLITGDPVARSKSLWLSVRGMSFKIAGDLPKLFVLSVLYFLCKSWREKVATRA